jgi:AcrR family transcriptional regulator
MSVIDRTFPMARKVRPEPTPRRRRTAEEARTAILDAAERRLVESGPAGIRLQEVAADVGVSHPTVLHHFGSREGLVEAVVARALESLHERLLEVVRTTPSDQNRVPDILEGCYEALAHGHGRAFLWLALSGYAPMMEELRVRSLAEAVHVVRVERRRSKKKEPPTFEDTYFTVLLPAFALLAMSATPPRNAEDAAVEKRFREWLAKIVHDHLEKG